MAASPVGDWLKNGPVTQLRPSKHEGKSLGCLWKDLLSRGDFVVKGTVSELGCLVYNPGSTAASSGESLNLSASISSSVKWG